MCLDPEKHNQTLVGLLYTGDVGEDTWDVYQINDEFELVESGYKVNAWFLHDWKPLSALESERSLVMLSWSLQDLLASLGDLTPEDGDALQPGERPSSYGNHKQFAGVEWGYLDRLRLPFPGSWCRMIHSHDRGLSAQNTCGCAHDASIEGEFWSPRKLQRRALWLEIDHAYQIRILRVQESSS